MEPKDVRREISEYMLNKGISRTWMAKKMKRSPTLVTLILDCKIKLIDSNLHKMNVALFEEDKSKYFKK